MESKIIIYGNICLISLTNLSSKWYKLENHIWVEETSMVKQKHPYF